MQVLVLITHEILLWFFDSLNNGLTEGVPILDSTTGGLHPFSPTSVVSTKVRKYTFSMCSPSELIRAFPNKKSVVNFGFTTFLDLVSFSRSPTLTAASLSTAVDNLSPSIILRRLFSSTPGTTIPTGLSPSFLLVRRA